VLLMAPTILTLLTGIGGRTRPMFNITISNVPGPDKPLYFRGAELLATYPASIVTHGQAVNITCQSYAGYMNFGYTGCHSSVPSMQRLAVYTGEALQELEDAVLPKAIIGGKAARKKLDQPVAAPARKLAARKPLARTAAPKTRLGPTPKPAARRKAKGAGAPSKTAGT
jgi:diacylglycerol O-acyltransferase